MTFKKGNKYRLKPKYTKEDLVVIRDAVDKEINIEDIFAIMYKRRPDVDPRTIFNWIQKVAMDE